MSVKAEEKKRDALLPADPQPNVTSQLNSLFTLTPQPTPQPAPQPVYIVRAPASTAVVTQGGAVVAVKQEEKLTEIAKAFQPLARILVGAMGLADESQVFTPGKGQGTDWTTYINPKYHAELTYALGDIKQYLIPAPDGSSSYSLLSIAENETARGHFAALVQYHESNKKLALNGTYRQKTADRYLMECYNNALWFFKTHPGVF